jgi:acyl-CoA thioester hydrolase
MKTTPSPSPDTTSAFFPVALPIRIDWSETDVFGHVNNVSFYKYIQSSRLNYWEAVGMLRYFDTRKLAPILASGSCHFRKPLHYPGNITLQCRTEFIRNTSFGFHHQILNENGEVAAEGNDVMVFFDFKTHQKQALPPEIKQAIEKLEEREFN